MKEYTRRITGVIHNYESYPDVDGKPIGDIVAEMIGKNRNFAGTISICVTDLTEDSGASTECPEVTEEVMKTISDVVCKTARAVTGALFEGDDE